MKVGDIVRVTDGSWSMLYDGNDGSLWHPGGITKGNRRWVVMATCLVGPVYTGNSDPVRPNNVMLREMDHPKNVLFTRTDHCIPAIIPPPEPERVTVPADTKKLTVTLGASGKQHAVACIAVPADTTKLVITFG